MNELSAAEPGPLAFPSGRILVVEDEPDVARAYARALRSQGLKVEVAIDGAAAVEKLDAMEFDVLLSDVGLPVVSGLDLVRLARARRPELPVVLMTARPTIEAAITCVEMGAFRYLIKPIEAGELCSVVLLAVHAGRDARAQREALKECERIGARDDTRALRRTFSAALEKIFMVAQPVVSVRDRRILAYEALVRSSDAAMPHPGALFDAADRLHAHDTIGRAIRAAIARDIAPTLPADTLAFVNAHPADLLDESLYDAKGPLAPMASRTVIEITERGSLELVPDLSDRVRRLRELGYRIAIDDLGAGYAGLTTFARVQPEVAKLDMTLVRNVHREPTKRRLIQSMGSFCKDMGIMLVCEGVETTDERDALLELGCDVQQGYLFAKPCTPFPAVEW